MVDTYMANIAESAHNDQKAYDILTDDILELEQVKNIKNV